MKIIVKKDQNLVQEKDIGQQEKILIGRSKNCDLVLADPYVSRKHASIEFSDGQWLLKDLGSDNGTRLKGKKIEHVILRNGEQFHIGAFKLMLASDIMKKTKQEVRQLTRSHQEDLHDELSQLTPAIKVDDSQSAAFLEAIAVSNQDQTVHSQSEGSLAQSETMIDHEAPTKEKNISEFIQQQQHNKLENAPQLEFTNFDSDHQKTMLHDVLLDDEVEELDHQDTDQKTAIIEEDDQGKTARLICLDEDRMGEEIALDKPQVRLGTAQSDDIRTHKKSNVATTYATLTIKEDQSVEFKKENDLEDAYVDGLPIDTTQLKNHDILMVGDAKFEFVDANSNPRAHIAPVMIQKHHPIKAYFDRPWVTPVLALLLGCMLAAFNYQLKKNALNKKNLANTAQEAKQDSEEEKVIIFHLSHASELLNKGQYDEAEARIRLILSTSPKNSDALKLLKKINTLREDEKQKTRDLRLEISRRYTKIRELLEKGDRLVEEKKFDEALKIYNEAKSLDPQNMESQAALKHLQQTQEESKRQDLARKNELNQLSKMFNQALEDFENNKFSDARKLLNQVVAKKNHQYYAPAQNILAEMRNLNNQYILNQVAQAKDLLNQGQKDAAYTLLLDLKSRYPNSKTVSNELDALESTLNQKAAQAYREGLTLLELANDPAAALDQFEKVLHMTKNPKNEYYKKAQEQIDKLKLGN